MHSLTKFLGGHGNSIGGAIVDGGTFDWIEERALSDACRSRRPSYHGIMLAETFGNFAFAIACRVLGLRDLGPAISPFNAFLMLTGIETLPLRMQRHCDNALAVAEWLAAHDKIAWVNYAGLPGNQFHALAKRYCPKGAGAVFTFGLKGGYDAGMALVRTSSCSRHLANIGDTRSLIIHPASTTHRQLTDEQRVKAGAGPEVVRLSIGIEDRRGHHRRSRSGARRGLRRSRRGARAAREPEMIERGGEHGDGARLMREPERDRHRQQQRPDAERRLQHGRAAPGSWRCRAAAAAPA